MIDLVKSFFGKGQDKGPGGQAQDPGHDVHVATCALLLEMAAIDGEFSTEERARLVTILREDLGIQAETVAALMDQAQREVAQSIDLWRFTRLIKNHYSVEEKIQVIEAIWKIVYADGRLDHNEDYLVHKLADLLGLRHSELIDAKLRVKASLEGA